MRMSDRMYQNETRGSRYSGRSVFKLLERGRTDFQSCVVTEEVEETRPDSGAREAIVLGQLDPLTI